jgi:hypothetical protein
MWVKRRRDSLIYQELWPNDRCYRWRESSAIIIWLAYRDPVLL